MNKYKIHTYEELIHQIKEVNSDRDRQETEIKSNVTALYKKFQLKNIIKETVKDLANDTEFKEDGFRATTNVATDFVLGRVFNKNNTVGGFIKVLLIEKLIVPLFEKNKDKITSFFTDIISKFTDKNKEE